MLYCPTLRGLRYKSCLIIKVSAAAELWLFGKHSFCLHWLFLPFQCGSNYCCTVLSTFYFCWKRFSLHVYISSPRVKYLQYGNFVYLSLTFGFSSFWSDQDVSGFELWAYIWQTITTPTAQQTREDRWGLLVTAACSRAERKT